MWKPLCPVFLFSSFVVPLAATGLDCSTWKRNFAYYFSTATIQYVKKCLEEGFNVAATRDDGHTALHFAAAHNEDPSVVQALSAHGANLNAKTDAGYTPLHAAAAFNPNLEVLRALLTAGADPTMRDEQGASLLFFAALNENLAGLEFLLGTGMDPKTPNDHGATPLHWAAGSNGNSEVIQVLLAAGAAINARDKDKSTPLHLAAASNVHPNVVRALAAAGADLNVRDGTNQTPLHLAAASNVHPNMVRALLAAGADPNVRDGTNQTPLERAAANENPMVIRAFRPPKYPFIKTFLRLDTTDKKLEHLRSWRPDMAKENGISEPQGYFFDALLKLLVFYHVDDKGVLDCEAVGINLMTSLAYRHKASDDSSVMFNTAVDDLCPKVLTMLGGVLGRVPFSWRVEVGWEVE